MQRHEEKKTQSHQYIVVLHIFANFVKADFLVTEYSDKAIIER